MELRFFSRNPGRGQTPGVLTARTASDGTFLLEGLPAGDYMITLSRQSFSASSAELRGLASARSQINGWTASLRAGQVIGGIEIRMQPAAVVTGHVLDQDGDPMAGVAMEAEQYRYVQGVKTLAASGRAISDDRGIYRIYGLAPGRYFVKAMGNSLRGRIGVAIRGGAAPGFGRFGPPQGPGGRGGGNGDAGPGRFGQSEESLAYLETYYPNARSAAEAVPLQLTPGAEMSGIDFTLAPSQAYSISGIVSGMDETPVPEGAQRPVIFVGARPASQPGFGDAAGLAQVNPGTGAFTIRNLAPGNYQVVARSNSRRGGAGGSSVGSAQVTLGNASIEGVHIQVYEDVAVPGKVTLPTGYSSTSLARMSITPIRRLNPVRSAARSDANGAFTITLSRAEEPRFVFSNLPDGLYVKRVLLGGIDLMASASHTLSSVSGSMTVELAADGASLKGVAKDSRGNPAANARITLLPASSFGAGESLAGIVWRNSTTALEDGSFEFAAIAPGRYRLYAFENLDADPSFDPDFLSNFGQRWKEMEFSAKQSATVEIIPIPASETAMYLGESE